MEEKATNELYILVSICFIPAFFVLFVGLCFLAKSILKTAKHRWQRPR